MLTCDDCATCTSRPELARDGLGRDEHEVERLARVCPRCGHRFQRHQHGLAKSSMTEEQLAQVSFGVGQPPADSPLGRKLAELEALDQDGQP